VVTTYGQSEILEGNESPPRIDERVVAQIPWTPGAPVSIDLVESDAGVVLP
jgi:hypothetical protein